jgi:hypothetical protein
MDQDDKYKPPQAEVSDPPRKPGSLLRAVLTGAAIEILGTLAVGVIAGLAYGALLGAQGYDEEAVKQMLTNADPLSGFGLIGSLLGAAVSVFAGFACAAIAARPDFRPVGILAVFSVCLGLLASGDAYPWHWSVIYSVLTVVCVGFGGWLHLKDTRPT